MAGRKKRSRPYRKVKYQNQRLRTDKRKQKDTLLQRIIKKFNKLAIKKKRDCTYELKEKEVKGKVIKNMVKVKK
jgi:hypothetical protein